MHTYCTYLHTFNHTYIHISTMFLNYSLLTHMHAYSHTYRLKQKENGTKNMVGSRLQYSNISADILQNNKASI